MKKLLLLTTAAACTLGAQTAAEPALKDVFKGAFRIGAALNPGHFTEKNAAGAALVKRHFNTITPENVLKWERVHPELERYDFEPTDAYVAFGEKNGMFIVGHTLVWHSQTPKWVFHDSEGKQLSREALLERMRQHIHKVVGRYKGRIHGWDVVNEALNEDGTMRESLWYKIIGPDYIEKAFEYAREADPKAELYYNDYSVENEPKRNGAVKLIRQLQSKGIKVAAVGLQGHNRLEWPTLEQQEATIRAFAELGVKVAITELDVDVLPSAFQGGGAEVSTRIAADPKLNPYAGGLPEDVQQQLAKRYAELFRVYLKYKGTVDRVTFWGVTDRESWLNNWPVRGRTSYPLIFDREGKPKPAFHAIVKAATESIPAK